ncbi:MAG: hypothetical protein PHU21_12790, partial [Elusimicrobia bacterium]|nr:hypothetical protein [Elusimicrobiota bacterium]
RMRKSVPAQAGDLLYILRRDVPTEADADPKAVYLESVGVARVEEVLSWRWVRLRVLKSVTDASPGDLLSRSPL